MSQTMCLLFGSILIHTGGSPVTGFEVFLLVLAAGSIIVLLAICWAIFAGWIKRVRYRNWSTVSAVVDIVSVAFFEDSIVRFNVNASSPYYLATLTYTYRNPEQQMGEYRRTFAQKEDAEAWA
ncbi:MAG TPA: hypothetical protein VFT88_01020, partial [Acidobacteriaceae bacterium]|nr:hypothetical protein [Acidobacteriaceae bacterium]